MSPCRTPRDGDYFDHFPIKDATNVDPMSAAAMGLDHFKSRTNYGFEYMKEKPHTRRKESLFQSGGEIHLSTSSSSATRSNSLKAPSVNDRRGSDSPLQDGSESPIFVHLRRKSSKRRNVPSVIAPLGVVTPDQHGADSTSSSGIQGRLLLTPSTPSDSCPSSLLALSPMNDLDRLSPVSPSRRYYYRSVLFQLVSFQKKSREFLKKLMDVGRNPFEFSLNYDLTNLFN